MPEAPIQIEQLADGKIICLRILDMSSEVAQTWLSEGQKRLASWSPDQPLLLLGDVRKIHNRLSADSMRTMYELSQIATNRKGKLAILIDDQASSQILAGVSQYTAPPNFSRTLFTSEADAVAWLLEE